MIPMSGLPIIVFMSGAVTSADMPNHMIVKPIANPLFCGNHFAITAIGQP